MSPHAWPIAVAGLVVVGLTVLGWLLLSVGNVAALVSWPTPDAGFVLLVIEGLLRLALPVAALVAVVLAVRRAAAARRRPTRPALPPAGARGAGRDRGPGPTARRLAGRRGDRCRLADRRRRGPGSARAVVVGSGGDRRCGDERSLGTSAADRGGVRRPPRLRHRPAPTAAEDDDLR